MSSADGDGPTSMIIVSGHLTLPAAERGGYLRACEEVVVAARRAPGCLDFAIAADLVDPARVVVLERWADRESLEAFREGGGPQGPTEDQLALIEEASVGEFAARALGDA